MKSDNITNSFTKDNSYQVIQTYRSFIRIHSDELKYMAPWAIYDNESNYEKNNEELDLKNEIINTLFCFDETKKK